jgi:hypothetical protein
VPAEGVRRSPPYSFIYDIANVAAARPGPIPGRHLIRIEEGEVT